MTLFSVPAHNHLIIWYTHKLFQLLFYFSFNFLKLKLPGSEISELIPNLHGNKHWLTNGTKLKSSHFKLWGLEESDKKIKKNAHIHISPPRGVKAALENTTFGVGVVCFCVLFCSSSAVQRRKIWIRHRACVSAGLGIAATFLLWSSL